MSLTVKTVLLLIAAILMTISAFYRPSPERINLFHLGWALVIFSLILS